MFNALIDSGSGRFSAEVGFLDGNHFALLKGYLAAHAIGTVTDAGFIPVNFIDARLERIHRTGRIAEEFDDLFFGDAWLDAFPLLFLCPAQITPGTAGEDIESGGVA